MKFAEIMQHPRRLLIQAVLVALAVLDGPSVATSFGQQPTPPNSATTEPKATLDIAPSKLDFGKQPVDSTSVVRTVTLSADRGGPVKNLAVSTSGDFIAKLEKNQLDAGGSWPISITFACTCR